VTWAESQSWQAGPSWLHNRREAVVEDHEEGEAEWTRTTEHEHEHAHGAQFSGRNTRLFDLALEMVTPAATTA
jgi:hypothetical protein